MKKIISLVMCLVFLLTCLLGCSTAEKDGTDSSASSNDSVSTDVVDDFPNVPRQDNGGKKFTILYPKWSFYDGTYYFSDTLSTDVVGQQTFSRLMMIEDHLGIDVDTIITTNDQFNGVIDVMNRIRMSAVSGTDDYQLALTHCFNGITSAAREGALSDFNELPVIDLDANYWRKGQMETIAINGKMYFGSGSFIIPDPCLVLFDKKTVSSIPGLSSEELYQSVRDKTWTLEKMKQYASNMTNAEDRYGFSSCWDWELIPFMTSEGYRAVTQNANGQFEVMDFNEKIDNICGEVNKLVNEEYAYYCESIEERNQVMSSGRTMFAIAGIKYCIDIIANSGNEIGILPYPSITEGQDYQNLDWSGYMVVPSTVQDKELAGSVVELLNYYGEKNVYPAFYDKLLTSRTADKVDDTEMLDIVFDSLVYDPALTYCDEAYSKLGLLFYVIPRTIEGMEGLNVASYYETYHAAAKKMVEFDF